MLVVLGLFAHALRSTAISFGVVLWYGILTGGHLMEHMYHLTAALSLITFVYTGPVPLKFKKGRTG